ncbi:MAG: MFS transporter, partial [Actinomycetota bacterium]
GARLAPAETNDIGALSADVALADGESGIGPRSDVQADGDDVATPSRAGPGGLWALFLGLFLLMLGNGLNGAVVAIRTDIEGFDVAVTGLVMAGYFAGFLLSPSAVVRMVPAVGHVRVFAGLASMASSAVLIHSVSSDPVTWTLMRFVFGFCAAGLYVVIESWLNDSTSPEHRGRTLSFYMIVSMMGLGAGQLLVGIGDVEGYALFVLASVLVSMSLVPMTLAASTSPPPMKASERTSVKEVWGFAASGLLAAGMAGVVTGAVFGLAAVYAARSGVSIERTGLFISMPMIGAVVLQFPIGWASDRLPRRGVIFAVACGLVTAGVLLALVDATSVVALGLMFVLGGTMFPLYSLALTYTLDWTSEAKTVGASGTLIRVNGTGAVVGPLVGAALMSGFGDRWLFWLVAAAGGVVVTFIGVRIVTRDGLPMDRQRPFVNIPGRASEFVYRMAPRPAVTVAKKVAAPAKLVAAPVTAAKRKVRSRSQPD